MNKQNAIKILILVKYGGTGIGLTLAKRFLEIIDSKISVRLSLSLSLIVFFSFLCSYKAREFLAKDVRFIFDYRHGGAFSPRLTESLLASLASNLVKWRARYKIKKIRK